MKIKLINFGYKTAPYRAHENDAGADVYATRDIVLFPHDTTKIPLGFGLELPDGYAAYIFPRSGLSVKGIVCELPPIDSGYRGEVHAIVSNLSDEQYQVREGDRVGQLVVMPVVIADFIDHEIQQRGDGAFASTGRQKGGFILARALKHMERSHRSKTSNNAHVFNKFRMYASSVEQDKYNRKTLGQRIAAFIKQKQEEAT